MAAKDFRPFERKEDGAAYILELTHLGRREVLAAHRPRESSLKHKGQLTALDSARCIFFLANTD